MVGRLNAIKNISGFVLNMTFVNMTELVSNITIFAIKINGGVGRKVMVHYEGRRRGKAKRDIAYHGGSKGHAKSNVV